MARRSPKPAGGDEIRRNLSRLARNYPARVGQALRIEAEVEMTEAKKRTPVDTGALRASGHVEGPEEQGRRMSVTLAFGGAASAYAVRVHEDLEAFHPVGQAKYLESVLNESAPYMGARLARRLRIDVRG